MTGTLQVENIIGPTTGSNTNTVTIPSTQTLDVSGGTLLPSAGQIIQEKSATTSTLTSHSTTSYVATNLTVNITPKFSNSIIRLQFTGSYWWQESGATDTYILPTIFRTVSGSSSNLGDSPYYALAFLGAPNGKANFDRMFTSTTEDSPNTTSQVTYTVYYKNWNTNYTGRLFESITKNIITATEIVQ